MVKNKGLCTGASILLFALVFCLPAGADLRYVFHSQGHLDKGQNVYYHFFKFFNPSATVGLVGPIRYWETENATLRGVVWFKGDDEGNFWTGPGFWPTYSLTDRVSVNLELRYLFGWGDTHSQFQVTPWVQYRFDERNALRLQGGLTEDLGDGEAQPWVIGPMWLYDLGDGMQFRLGYQKGLEGDPERRLLFALNFNM